LSDHQRQFSREEIEEHLRAVRSRPFDLRAPFNNKQQNVLSYLRDTERRQELRQLLAAEKKGQKRNA
jgi:hypothetical protein